MTRYLEFWNKSYSHIDYERHPQIQNTFQDDFGNSNFQGILGNIANHNSNDFDSRHK